MKPATREDLLDIGFALTAILMSAAVIAFIVLCGVAA